MRIRAIVAACGAASAVFSLSAASSPAEMQQPVKMYRVGILTAAAGSTESLRQSLRDLGYVEGRNVILEIRDTEGRPERANDLALQLARLKVDVIVATNPAAVFGAKRATATIPIVMMHTPDPVQLGLVASLARPGGNITGTTTLSVELSVKQLELLKEAVPRASRMALVWNPDNPWHPRVVKALRDEHRLPGVQLQIVEARRSEDFNAAFQAMIRERAQGVLVLADPMTFTYRSRLADLAAKHRLPLMGGPRGYTDAGGLMSYWADESELSRRAASYVDRILKGASPESLPIEQPTKYDLVINLKTAKTLGLTLPASLSLRATVVE
ncbi:MAG: ABC transporter substrate-binding protein [Candidatus Rokuibacteriota bacterium]|nr:MAG: ABC transporter substrate-binding protein [Candidatus Rokubacteria bacterium]PYN54211.1 MAG: ABC transporter substrate-binding protein [Candidatus Rokubacteria bacterium]